MMAGVQGDSGSDPFDVDLRIVGADEYGMDRATLVGGAFNNLRTRLARIGALEAERFPSL